VEGGRQTHLRKYATLWRGLGNRIHLKSDCRLRQQSAAHRCSSVHRDHSFCQYDAFEVRGSSKRHSARDLPEDVLGQCAAGQSHARSVGLLQRSCHLEDPDIVRAARERDIRCNRNTGRPFVKAEEGERVSPIPCPSRFANSFALVRGVRSEAAGLWRVRSQLGTLGRETPQKNAKATGRRNVLVEE
jgi:hypothetical protein